MENAKGFYVKLINGEVTFDEFEVWVSMQRDEAWHKAAEVFDPNFNFDDLR